MMKVFVLVLIASCVAWQVSAYGEPDSTGRPVWQDRANHALVNAVRLNPSSYKTIYMAGYSPSVTSILTATYPAVAPLYLCPQLDDSSYNHSLDMAQTNTFSHSSSDGTAPFTRIGYFYTCSGTQGENIAAGYASPQDTNNQWLCDSTGSACAADGSGSDGHRSNIMSKNYKVIGVGFSSKQGSTYTNYWTQDFGGASCAPAPTNPIFGGSHIFVSSNTKFLAQFYQSTATAPSSAKVYVDGTANALSYELGMADGQGNYIFSQAKGSACRNYYFEFVAGGVTYRYPDTGFLVTYGEGSCVTSFNTASASTTAAPTTSAPTTSAPTTSAPTTSAPTTSAPTTSAPTTTAPTTSAPTTTAPTTSAPTTTAPTTSAPTTTAPTTSAPTTRRPWSTNAPTTTTTAPTTTRAASTSAPTTSAPTTTAPTTTKSASTTSAPSGNVADTLSGHNAARSAVKQAALTWNDTIASFATSYAQQCVFQHNSNRNGYGENIYASSGTVSATSGKDATNSWVSEKANFNCASNTCASGKTCGHYTQVIWGSTNQMGCGFVTCTTNSPFGSSFPTWTFVVCDYNPPGNYVGQSPVPASSC